MTKHTSLPTFAANLSAADIPADVRDRARLIIADTIGAIIGGMTTEPVQTLCERYANRYTGGGSVLGTDVSLPADHAAMLNGIAGTVLELDEGHKRAAGHPAIHVFPAVLAVAEVDDGTFGDVVTAFVAGYETAVRVARACNPLAEGYHPHGVWGIVGAAAAVANYQGVSNRMAADVLSIAANHAQHTRFEAAFEGATVRDTYAGMVAPDAIRAVDQAQAGFTGIENGISIHLEHATADTVGEISTADLGDHWELLNGYFKIHAACRYTHPTLDAVDELATKQPLEAEMIESISVETYPAAAKLADPQPETRLAAKFSIPFAVASRIIHGHAGKKSFEPDAFRNEVYNLADRVSVDSTPKFADAVPDSRGARVTIIQNGSTSSSVVRHARGSSARPIDEFRLCEKFHTLVDPVLDDGAAEEAWSLLHSTSEQEIHTLCNHITAGTV